MPKLQTRQLLALLIVTPESFVSEPLLVKNDFPIFLAVNRDNYPTPSCSIEVCHQILDWRMIISGIVLCISIDIYKVQES
jgi:hypothetical protein